MRGRKPTPTPLRVLRGNPSRRPLPKHEPQSRAVVGPPPDWLQAEAVEAWRELAPMLERLRVLTEADRGAFLVLCETFALWRAANRKVLELGLVASTEKGDVVSPYVRIAQTATTHLRALLAEFGLTPSSRSRVSTTPAAPVADKWAGLL